MNTKEWEKEFVEKGAALEHERWARWQNYLHSFLTWNNDIQMWTLPHEKKEWWDSEIRTPYHMLNEIQKESDRKEARTYLPLIRSLLSSHTQEIREKVEKLEEYVEAKDNDCHRYQIPSSKAGEWDKFLEIPSDDERSWDVPEWAERIDGMPVKSFKDSVLQILESNE